MRINTVTYNDINNGPGVRISLWTQGCAIHCPGCHNSSLWDYNGGQEYTPLIRNEILYALNNKFISGLSILGGEPLSPINLEDLKEFLRFIKLFAKEKSIWLYTGYTWESLTKEQKELLPYIDVLVDGPYLAEQRDTSLAFRGSKNQRLIDVQKSLKQNKIILYETQD